MPEQKTYIDEYNGFRRGDIIKSYFKGYWRVDAIYRNQFDMIKLEQTQVANGEAYPPRNMKRCCVHNLCSKVTPETINEEIKELNEFASRLKDLSEEWFNCDLTQIDD